MLLVLLMWLLVIVVVSEVGEGSLFFEGDNDEFVCLVVSNAMVLGDTFSFA